jgi:hypothetical protein
MIQKYNYNVQEYRPFMASCKSSPNLKHCKEIYFIMHLFSSFSCISSDGSTQVELLTSVYWDIDFSDVQSIASLEL